MHEEQNNKETHLIEWEAPTRAQKKDPHLIKLLVVLGFVVSILLFFITEYLLIFGVWVIIFVYYLMTVLPPSKGHHKISGFGVYWYGDIVPYSNIHAFSISLENNEWVLRLYNNSNGLSSIAMILPKDEQKKEQIKEFLDKKVPYLDQPNITDTEKLSRFFSNLLGIN